MPTRRLPSVSVVLGLALASALAHAGNPRAEELFRQGRDAMSAGDLATACTRFEESLALESSVGPLLNLADCQEQRGKLVRALELWKEGLSRMPEDDGRRDLARRRITDLERRGPKIVVSAAAGARILIDSEAAQAGVPHPVDPGHHVIVVTGADGSRRIEVDVTEGQALPVDATASGPGAAPPTVAPEADDAPSMVPAAVAYGVGGAGLVVFGITGALWLGEKSTVDAECPERRCTPEGLAAGDAGQTLGIVNAIGLGTFVVGAGLGTFFLVRGTSASGSARAPGATARVSWAGSGARLDGTF
jgi:hypothetical protein